jgi:hypothetical protein
MAAMTAENALAHENVENNLVLTDDLLLFLPGAK